MTYTCGPIASLFKKTYSVTIGVDQILFSRKGTSVSTPLIDITSVGIKKEFLWSAVVITTSESSQTFPGYSNKQAISLSQSLTKAVKTLIANKILEQSNQLDAVEKSANELCGLKKYISHTDLTNLSKSASDIQKYLDHFLFDETYLPADTQNTLKTFSQLRNHTTYVKSLNDQFIQNTIETYSDLFSSIEKFPLSDEQMRAAVIDEDRNLLIAAAGSGKTSSIVAKGIYLIASGLASAGELLILSYNKDAQQELERRFTDLINVVPHYTSAPKVKTFHGYGYELLTQANNQKPQISDYSSDKKQLSRHFNNIIKHLYKSDESFKQDWREFLLIGRHQAPDLFNIKTKKQYDEILKELGAKRKRRPDGYQLMIPTIDGNEVRSIEEARIANWLALNGVDYQYEKQYINPKDKDENVKYNPDFYYPTADLYHEHFAINAKGETPPFIPQEKYTKGIEWKRETHNKNGTKLIETHSAHAWDGTLFQVLKSQLEAHGIKTKPLSEEATNKLMAEKFDSETDTELFISFLSHFKANNLSIELLRSKLEGKYDKGRATTFLNLFEAIYREYEKRLDTSDCIDFQDQIILACQILEAESIHHPFKYILVDEFQDTSQDRKRLINALLNQNDKTKLFAVGDDWQSIYRFSGADITIMTQFADHFGASSINYLTKTYRSYQGITDVAAEFVQKNPSQLKKSVSAIEDIDVDQITIYGYGNLSDLNGKLVDILTTLNQVAENAKLSVFLLGRYNHLKPKYIGKYRNLKINFQSIHSSKGLQADYVILLNLESGLYGFPSTVSDDPLLSLVISKLEEYPHAEERRLFYVALTRAKKGVYILSNQNSISPFAAELAKAHRVTAKTMTPKRNNPCPKCDTGTLKKRSGKYGAFLGCSNFPKCKYTEKA